MRPLLIVCLLSSTAFAKPTERRLHSDNVEASSFLGTDWNRFVESYHPNYIADDDSATAWVEGSTASGAGDWVRLNLTYVDATKIRLRIRNGYQKSKELFAANARAKEVVVRLLPNKQTKKVTLEDKDGWQEVVIEQPSTDVEAIELNVLSVYEGSKYADLAISDVQVFATSESDDNPAYEKSKRQRLMQWRAARLAAAKLFANRTDLPIYAGYAITTTDSKIEVEGIGLEQMVNAAASDATFAKEWKEALAIAKGVTSKLDALPRVQIAPRTSAKLVTVDGVEIADPVGIEGPYHNPKAFRLPMLGTVASLFADQLRVVPLGDRQTVSKFEETYGPCKDTTWALRKESKETPAQLQAVITGRCMKVEGRGGWRHIRVLELAVFDAQGRAVLVVGEGHVEGYRWTVDNGKSMIAGARSLVHIDQKIVEAKKRDTVAAK